MRAAIETGAVALMLAALITAFRTWMRSEPRPLPSHAAPRREIVVELARASDPPAGYGADEDTDTWLATAPPRIRCNFGDLAPAALDAAADTMPPWPAPVETAAERDAWVQASLAADQPLEQPALQPLPQLGCRPVLPPLARQGVWQPRAEPAGRHCAPEPEAPSDRDFVRSVIGDTDAAGERATELPLVVYAQLGGRTPAEYVDELFAGMVVTGA
jgi:hypothetical protein